LRCCSAPLEGTGGGIHEGRIRPCVARPGARLMLEFDSPPLSGLARDVNKYSNNVMAKMLFLNLGAARYGAPATWDKGAGRCASG
jgi:D-alanyl-D-alanine carboxypeptidase/D-alanyl-D-alanine-endopeptidase (penicillin-binding protein 4)